MSMKHYIYITLAIVLTIVAACTEHPIDQGPQVPESSRSYIFFEPEVMEVGATKATLVEGETLPAAEGTAFGVMGYYNGTSVLGGYEDGVAKVYRNSKGGSFQYDHLGWWLNRDVNATTKHNFFAFYPYSIYGDVSLNEGSPYISYTLPETETEMMDIMTAYTETARVLPVPLEFQHRLWALDVEVVNRQTGDGYSQPGAALTPADLTVVSVKVTLANIPISGTMALAGTGCTVNSRATREYTLPQTNIKISPADDPETADVKENAATFGPLLFLPTPVSYTDENGANKTVSYKLDFTFRNHWGVEYTQSFPLSAFKLANEATAFEPGKRYKLTVVKNDTEASVGLTVTKWETQDVTHTFQ